MEADLLLQFAKRRLSVALPRPYHTGAYNVQLPGVAVLAGASLRDQQITPRIEDQGVCSPTQQPLPHRFVAGLGPNHLKAAATQLCLALARTDPGTRLVFLIDNTA